MPLHAVVDRALVVAQQALHLEDAHVESTRVEEVGSLVHDASPKGFVTNVRCHVDRR